MKKTKWLAVAIALTFAFVSCQKEPSDSEKKPAKVSEVSISDVTVINNKSVEQKTSVQNAEEFETVVLPVIAEQVITFASAIIAENSEDSEEAIITTKENINFAREAETLTLKTLEAAFDDLPKKLKESATIDNEKMTASIDFDWEGPTGNINTEMPGVEASVSKLNMKIKGSLNGDQETQKINLNGSASANAAFSLSATIPEEFGADGLKNIKLNVLGNANADKISLVGNPELLAIANSMEDDTDGENKDEPAVDPATLFDSISGKLYLYGGISGASYFEVKNADKEYNGVIKATVNLSIDESLSKDKIVSIINTLEKLDSKESEVSGKDLDTLPVKINIAISVYNVAGKKLFDYLTVDSFEKLEETAKKFMPKEA